jgi:hypothetical protein
MIITELVQVYVYKMGTFQRLTILSLHINISFFFLKIVEFGTLLTKPFTNQILFMKKYFFLWQYSYRR